MTAACAGIVLLVAGICADFPEIEERQLSNLEGWLRTQTVTANVRTYRGTGAPPELPVDSPGDSLLEYQCIVDWGGPDRFRVTRLYTSAGADSAELIGTKLHCSFDGIDALLLSMKDDACLVAIVSSNVTPEHYIDPSLTWLGVWPFHLSEPSTLAILVALQNASEGTISEHAIPTRPEARLTIERDSEGRYRRLVFDARKDGGAKTQMAVMYDPPFDRVTLPARAVIKLEAFDELGKCTNWEIQEVELVDVTPRQSIPALEWESSVGCKVVDKRYGLAYTVGEQVLNVEGREITTTGPLLGDVGRNIDAWMTPVLVLAPPISTPPKERGRLVSAAIAISLIAAVGGALLVLRKRSALLLVAACMVCHLGCERGAHSNDGGQAVSDREMRDDDDADPALWIEFGDVDISTGSALLKERIAVKNEGKSVLDVAAIKTSCSCITSSIDAKSIQPGSATHLNVELLVRTPGYLQQAAHVIFGDGSHQTYTFTARGVRPRVVNAVLEGIDIRSHVAIVDFNLWSL